MFLFVLDSKAIASGRFASSSGIQQTPLRRLADDGWKS